MTIILDNPKLEQDIPLDRIHPDPFQPRLNVDAELADSIRSQGVLQAISVEVINADSAAERICPDCRRPFADLATDGWHFMIQDGERRYRGALAAGLKTLLAKVVPPVDDDAQRLIRQLTANTGKPLTPIEEAFAFQRLMDEEGWSQAELARQISRPRSVVGDRIRLTEIHTVWMKLIESGRLQVSHAPLIHQYRAVPDEYQVKAAKKITEGEGWQIAKYALGDVIPISAFRDILRDAFKDYIVRLDEVRSYKGPVLGIEEEIWSYGTAPKKLRKVKYAADITIWRPIKREAEKRAKKARESQPRANYSGGGSWLSGPQKAVKALKAAGFDPPLRQVGNTRVLPKEGEFVIVNEQGFAKDLHPKVLLAKIDPTSITYVKGNFGGDELYTSDAAAVAQAREAYRQHVVDVTKKELAPLRDKLTPKALSDYAVAGPGVVDLLSFLNPERGTPKVVAIALGLIISAGVGDSDSFDDEEDGIVGATTADASRLLSALAAIRALDIKVPDDWQIGQLIRKGIADVPFKVAPAPKSKKQEKREARAAGKQVGDPSRAKKDKEVPIASAVDVGAMRAAVEAGAVDELEEANA